jgi:hypothetical protein
MSCALPGHARPINDGRTFIGYIASYKGSIMAWTPSGRRLGEYGSLAAAVVALKTEFALDLARSTSLTP